MHRIAFLINCSIPHWEKTVSQIEKTFEEIPYQIFLSEYSGHVNELVIKAVRQDFKSLVVAGGDGSVNELVNGLVAAHTTQGSTDWNKMSDYTLGIIPMGTGNDFVKSMSKNLNLQNFKSLILQNQRTIVDIGLAEFTDKNQEATKRYFINITDVGMGGVVVAGLEKGSKLLSKSIRYNIQIAKTFFTYKKSEVKITTDNYSFQGKVMNVILANGKYFGNGLGIAPEAELQDGLLELVILGDIGIIDYLTNLSQVKKCKKLDHPQVFYQKTNEVNIVSADNRELPIDMDGEFVGYAPLKILNLSKRIYFYS